MNRCFPVFFSKIVTNYVYCFMLFLLYLHHGAYSLSVYNKFILSLSFFYSFLLYSILGVYHNLFNQSPLMELKVLSQSSAFMSNAVIGNLVPMWRHHLSLGMITRCVIAGLEELCICTFDRYCQFVLHKACALNAPHSIVRECLCLPLWLAFPGHLQHVAQVPLPLC